MFTKILIANRGEVAVRIIRACKEMGILTVAVYSEADADALHTNFADECYCIGPAPVKDSYLNMDAILTVAVQTGCEAVHPGYGLLSENAEFAEKCRENGLTFIGPDPDVIRRMGDKNEARRTMKEAGVPVIEGSEILADAREAVRVADRIGYPVLLKARSGGGGKGIRPVYSADEMDMAFMTASAEAETSFGDSGLYVEKFLDDVKHIEVQILGDSYGKVLTLSDRDCSVQRRKQKLIEECPAPTLDETTRAALHEAARRAAEAVGYVTVGTVEFLVEGSGRFYFMEMNTRLQVEHSVTEMATGVDLVKWQIRTAAGLPIAFEQEDVQVNGHAIECRICAEHPYEHTPSCGEITILHIPGGPDVRFDSAVYQNYVVPPYYDSMVGKLIVCSKTREEAIRKMRTALSELVVYGIVHNSELHIDILAEPAFRDGSYTTKLLEKGGK